jgi:GntR family transcriptional regulator
MRMSATGREHPWPESGSMIERGAGTMTTMQARPAARAGAPVAVPQPRADGLVGSPADLQPAGEVPLHLQLHTVLDRAVDASGLAHGERIWSESQLMRHYNVSRHVVRQALNQLVLEGRLSVRKGAGYFVNRRWMVEDLRSVEAATGTAIGGVIGGEELETELLEIGVGPTADADEAALVPRRQRPRVHRVRMVGRVEGEPVALLSAAFPAAMSKVLSRRAVIGEGVLPALAARGHRPRHADLQLEVSFASGAEGGLLGVAEGAPLMMIRSRLCGEAGELLAVSRQLYRTDRFRFAYGTDVEAPAWPGDSR